ncbi:hypothetical protein ACIBL5_06340 [Streptomyces sp. NPDC050516]|uniref:hypothetical protein n=1 Tax=Streptomyces sp. NPDC050516 TaxID=3365621 RepID=UPI0037BB306B
MTMPTLKPLAMILATLSLFVLSVSSAWAVGADANSRSVGTASREKGFMEIANPDGSTVSWMSLGYAKAHPEKAREFGLEVQGDTLKPLSPPSANECDGDICIDVIGSGVVVNQWTTVLFGNFGCQRPTFLRNWGNYYTGDYICPGSGETGAYRGRLTGPMRFSDNDALCNTWGNLPGMPCVSIKR